ncbi:MAG: hypothetical protein HY238_11565, partial [Acidobacteria bacterium]|nr:hypothetical protein [Acidobacteriota bacterium]
VYIGLESLSQESLQWSNKRHNKVHEYKQRIRWLHDNDVNVMSIFLVGLDGDTPEYLRNLPDLVDDVGVDVPVFSFAAPIEGTPFHQDLKDQGRLVPGDILGGMDGMHLLYKPQGLSPDELEMALFDCQRRAYSPGRVVKRILRRAGNGFWSTLATASGNIFYMPYQRALARVGLARVRARGPWPGRGITEPSIESDRPEVLLPVIQQG